MWRDGGPEPLVVVFVAVGVAVSVLWSAGDALSNPAPSPYDVTYSQATATLPMPDTISTSTDGASLPIDYALAMIDNLPTVSASTAS